MKIKEKFLISMMGILAVCLILNPIKSQAALQANGNAGKTDTINNWMKNIRLMESVGGTLGLTGGVDGTNLSSTGTANNLDIHMEKNTEYGAMAILSASAYGNKSKITNGQTTTGNKSGIYIYLNKERVAAGQTDLEVANFKNAVGKYKNAYEIATVGGKVGDAITETKGWHGSEASEWLWNNGSGSSLLRAYAGSLFSYYGKSGHHTTAYDASLNKPWSSRAVIVVGNGY